LLAAVPLITDPVKLVEYTGHVALDFVGTKEYVSDQQMKSQYFTYTLHENCSFDYNCYVSDDVISKSPYPYKLAIVVDKRTHVAKMTFLQWQPTIKLTLDFNPFKEGLLFPYKQDFYSYLKIGVEISTTKPENATGILSQKPVNLGTAKSIIGKIVFDEKPEQISNLANKGFLYYGTANNTFNFTSVKYDGDKTLNFDMPFSPFFQNLYTNNEYMLQLFSMDASGLGLGSKVDCTTGAPITDVVGTVAGTVNPVSCSVKYLGQLNFTLAEDGKIKVVNADIGEKVNDDKVLADSLFIRGISIITSPMDAALSGAVRIFAAFLEDTTRWVMGAVRGLLETTADYVIGPIGSKNGGVLGPWTALRNIALSLLVMALVIIAFANVLQIDIEQYGLNRMIPKIILSIIMAFASWIIVVFFFDFTKALQDQAIGLVGGTNGLDAMGKLSISVPTTGDIIGKMGAVLLLIVLLVGVLVCGVVLLFTLVLRVVMLSFLLAVAPLAFILNIVPLTSSLYKQWWTEFWKWMFMGPVALIIIALGSVIASNATGGAFSQGISIDASQASTGDGGRLMIGLIIFAAALYMAATLPMQWGGKIMQGWGKLGKGLWGKTGGAVLKAGGKAAWENTGGRVKNRLGGIFTGSTELMKQKDKRWALEQRAKMAEKGGLRGFIAGGDETDARNMRELAMAGHQSRFKQDMDNDPSKAAEKLLNLNPNSYEAMAARRELGEAGKLEIIGAQMQKKNGGLAASYGNVSFVDDATGNWADKDGVKRKIISDRTAANMAGGMTQETAEVAAKKEADTWAGHFNAAKDEGHKLALSSVAKQALTDRRLQEALLDKNMAVAMGGRGAARDSAEYKMYRGAISKQGSKQGKETNHNLIKYANQEDFTADAAKIHEIATKGTSKSQGALKGRFLAGNLNSEQAAAYAEANPQAEAELLEIMGREARPGEAPSSTSTHSSEPFGPDSTGYED